MEVYKTSVMMKTETVCRINVTRIHTRTLYIAIYQVNIVKLMWLFNTTCHTRMKIVYMLQNYFHNVFHDVM